MPIDCVLFAFLDTGLDFSASKAFFAEMRKKIEAEYRATAFTNSHI